MRLGLFVVLVGMVMGGLHGMAEGHFVGGAFLNGARSP